MAQYPRLRTTALRVQDVQRALGAGAPVSRHGRRGEPVLVELGWRADDKPITRERERERSFPPVNLSFLPLEIRHWIEQHPGSAARFTPEGIALDDGRGLSRTFATVAAAAAAVA